MAVSISPVTAANAVSVASARLTVMFPTSTLTNTIASLIMNRSMNQKLHAEWLAFLEHTTCKGSEDIEGKFIDMAAIAPHAAAL